MNIKEIDWKRKFKTTLKARMIIIGFVFTIVGWLLLGVLLLGRFFEEELRQIEELVQSTAFVWSLRISILRAVAILV